MALDKQGLLNISCTAGKPKEIGPVPPWGDTVFIRRLSGNDRDAWDLWQLDRTYTEDDQKAGKGKAGMLKSDTRGIRAFLVCLGLCDENGKRLFDDGEAPLVGQMDGQAIDFLYDEIRDYNGMSKKSKDAAGKNSGEAGNGDSGSGSPENLE